MIDGKVFGLETMRNKTWVSRDHLRIANIIWLTVLFLATGALTTVVFEKPATTQSSNPIVLDETRNRIPPKPVPTTTTSTTTLPPVKKNQPLPAPTQPPRQVPATQPPVIEPGDDIYLRLAQCESGDPTYNGSSGFDGAFQFLPSTWNGMNTGYAFAYEAPFEVQLDAAKRLIARSGWGQFPACARKLGML